MLQTDYTQIEITLKPRTSFVLDNMERGETKRNKIEVTIVSAQHV